MLKKKENKPEQRARVNVLNSLTNEIQLTF